MILAGGFTSTSSCFIWKFFKERKDRKPVGSDPASACLKRFNKMYKLYSLDSNSRGFLSKRRLFVRNTFCKGSLEAEIFLRHNLGLFHLNVYSVYGGVINAKSEKLKWLGDPKIVLQLPYTLKFEQPLSINFLSSHTEETSPYTVCICPSPYSDDLYSLISEDSRLCLSCSDSVSKHLPHLVLLFCQT